MLLRRRGALRRAASQDLHERLGAGHARACLLPFAAPAAMAVSAGRGPGDGGHGPVPRPCSAWPPRRPRWSASRKPPPLLEELAGVPVGTKHVERTAEAVGRAIARDEARAPAAPAPAPAPTAYLGLDGTGIPVRKSETAGRKGKQEGGRNCPHARSQARARVDCRAAGRGGPSATRSGFGQLLRSCGKRRQPRHRSATFRLRPARAPGGGPPRLPLRRPPGRDRRRSTLDLEPGRRAVPPRRPDCRPVPRQGAVVGPGQGALSR